MHSAEPVTTVAKVVLSTQRLLLRRLSLDDAGFIRGLLNEPSFLENIGDKGVRSAADAREYITSGPLASYRELGFGLYLVELAASGEPIGICGLIRRQELDDVDVGFALLPQFWSRGYATEAAAAVMTHGRQDFGLRRLLAITSPGNTGSQRVLEKLGFVFDRATRLSADASEVYLFMSEA